MPRQCAITGKRVRIGGSKTLRGKAKYLGGVGIKVTGRSKRKFCPNLQKVRVEVDGAKVRLYVSATAIRNGDIKRPLKRDLSQVPRQAAAASA